MKSFGFAVILSAAICCAAQAPQPKPTSAKKPRPRPLFECPDPEAKQACKSYEELLRAKDSGLPNDDYVYACFRKKTDAFFMLSFAGPSFQEHWDQDRKQMVADREYTPPGYGWARAYTNGIADSSDMPSLSFSGTWHAPIYKGAGTFISDYINFKEQNKEDKDVGVSIDDEQISVAYKYENKLEETIRYELVIQRSTGRFSETFQKVKQQIPIQENIGYCVYRH